MDATEERPDFDTDYMDDFDTPILSIGFDGCGYDRLSVPFPY